MTLFLRAFYESMANIKTCWKDATLNISCRSQEENTHSQIKLHLDKTMISSLSFDIEITIQIYPDSSLPVGNTFNNIQF